MNKTELLEMGLERLLGFCVKNDIVAPEVHCDEKWSFNECAYYRPTYIRICVKQCAHIGRGGASWSYPGYTVDRTPYGVLAHELGHHCDITLSDKKYGQANRYFGNYSHSVWAASSEEKLTNYCPNTGEWFAEMFRLFVTNPDLLKVLRPKTYARLREDWEPVEDRAWQVVLSAAPGRTIAAAEKKVAAALGKSIKEKQPKLC